MKLLIRHAQSPPHEKPFLNLWSRAYADSYKARVKFPQLFQATYLFVVSDWLILEPFQT